MKYISTIIAVITIIVITVVSMGAIKDYKAAIEDYKAAIEYYKTAMLDYQEEIQNYKDRIAKQAKWEIEARAAIKETKIYTVETPVGQGECIQLDKEMFELGMQLGEKNSRIDFFNGDKWEVIDIEPNKVYSVSGKAGYYGNEFICKPGVSVREYVNDKDCIGDPRTGGGGVSIFAGKDCSPKVY